MRCAMRVCAFVVAAGGVMVALAVVPAASAATMTRSSIAPTSASILQPDFSNTEVPFGNMDSTANPPPGQSFMPLTAMSLSSITIKGFADNANSFGGGVNTGTWTITISQITGLGNLSTLRQEVLNPAVVTDGDDYYTITLAAPVSLGANTGYAYDIFSSTGYFFFAKSSGDAYAFGQALQHGSTIRSAPSGAPIVNGQAVDRTFFINAVPEPASAYAVALFALVLARRRRRA